MSDKEKNAPSSKDAEYKADARDGDGDGLVQDGTIHERVAGYTPDAHDGDGDGMVQDGTVFARAKGTELSIEEQKAAVAKAAKSQPKSESGQAVSGNAVDDVYLSSCVYKNEYQRKSLTVHHLQRRLAEVGYDAASGDKDGYYGDNTKLAVEQYQRSNQLEATGIVDERTFNMVFAGDPNVRTNL
jgi:hypothetical protein